MSKILVGVFFSILLVSGYAQDQVTFSDEELTKYASVMVWAEMDKGRMADSVELWVKSNDKLSASVYNDLSKASKKGSIEDTDATAEEKSIFNDIQERIEGQKEEFKEVYIGKIKEDIGAGLYNDLKKALRSDQALKERYNSLFDSLMSETVGGDEEESVD